MARKPVDRFAHVPSDLKAIPRWVIWRRSNGTKIPQRPDSLDATSAHDPASWMSFDAAVDALSRAEPTWILVTGHGGGLGFMPSVDDNVVFIDLDGCRDPATGDLAWWAQEVLALFGDAYVEVSPSMKGLRILCRGPRYPQRPKLQAKVDVAAGDLTVDGKDSYVEMYAFGQFCTVTGNQYSGQSALIDCTEGWDALMAQYGGPLNEWGDEADAIVHHNYPEPDLNDVRAALAYFDSGDVDRNTFVTIGHVIKHLFDEDGFEVWAEWMARSPDDDPDMTRGIWEGLRGAPRSMSVGTIYRLAQDRGWEPPWRSAAASDFDDALDEDYLVYEAHTEGGHE